VKNCEKSGEKSGVPVMEKSGVSTSLLQLDRRLKKKEKKMSHDWEVKFKALGLPDEKSLFETLYKTQSLSGLCKSLGISAHLARKKLLEHGILIRKRGGPNSLKLVMTAGLIEEMKTKGAAQVALEQKVSKYTLFKQKAKFLKEHPPAPTTNESPTQSTEPAAVAPLDPIEG
jgi:hypothetical protein